MVGNTVSNKIFPNSFTIFHKLMTTFLILSIVLLASTLFLARWSFEKGFLDYPNALEQVRLQIISNDLILEFESAGRDWHKVSKVKVNEILKSLPRPKHRDPSTPISSIPTNNNDGKSMPRVFVLPGGKRKGPSTALFDGDGGFLIGSDLLLNIEDNRIVSVPLIQNGKVIAILKSIPVHHFSETIPTEFSKRQRNLSFWVGGVGLVLAIAISWFLALFLSQPLKSIMRAIASLSNGDFSIKLERRGKDEIGQLIDNVNILSKTLESSRESRRHWLANISHDLRTPITILAGEIQSLKDGVRKFSQERLDSLEQEVFHLRKLTDDLYQLSISDIGGLRYEFLNAQLNELMEAIVSSYDNTATDYGLKLCYQGEPAIASIDFARLSQLFSNILSNSISYTDAPGNIQVRLFKDKYFAIIKIEDSYPSVLDKNYDKLFDPLFRQDTSRNMRKEGSGLGLAICKQIVEAHQGQISAMPSHLGGLKLIVKIPLAKEQ
ncbi:integral membrane sensor signal transduction histidine kinase [Marinomonas posidonica IVIA-Po-181]|uniref:histidine kinase n=1 Tax=Marinomonas posidonica (strain CECT 7376 / NCIMB 14433 / IVIA-Po-181) TaxID=491952 RepID=F6D102_MARPP|nr:integral membrane sensor signal transduction histidine kinase [Marinomonas posidonica IVIA-Po-181]